MKAADQIRLGHTLHKLPQPQTFSTKSKNPCDVSPNSGRSPFLKNFNLCAATDPSMILLMALSDLAHTTLAAQNNQEISSLYSVFKNQV